MKRLRTAIFWFRRDLRIEDNHGLYAALRGGDPVLPLFIFDSDIVDDLEPSDPRISFIHDQLNLVHEKLNSHSSGLYVIKDKPADAWTKVLKEYDVSAVYFNEDYEPYARERDGNIKNILAQANVPCHTFKDQVIFAKDEILKADNSPYTVFTPYKNKWTQQFELANAEPFNSSSSSNYLPHTFGLPSLSELGFVKSEKSVLAPNFDCINNYHEVRNFPSLNGTSNLSPHLRFGTVSVRAMVNKAIGNEHFLSELIWREFFMQILFHFPHVVNANFKPKYDAVQWRNNEAEFEKWKDGNTGYPMVDAGMRELNTTGYMHNRVRMITAGFLCKHLLIDWRWGEAYFAEKLLDYELASNNGNWQWAAGTGCDAAPYFRVFNPTTQVQKFDKELTYINKWVPELNSLDYPTPMVDHKMARERAINAYKEGLSQTQ